RLTQLTLHGNHALGLPRELLGPIHALSGPDLPPANPKSILDYYFELQVEGAEPMREVRVLLVGRGRVGKTSLLNVLRGEKLDPGEEETPGITVLPLDLQCARGSATAHAWDFGGQEFLHGTHQIFLSERCVYLLVLEGRESNWESETDYWLRFIQSFGGESPVVVALNKYDAHSFTVDRFRLQEKCPQIAGFVQTDALTGRGIAELRTLLETTVNGMPDVWLGVPRRWHRVKEKLAGMPQSFLEYKDYQALCVEMQVTDEGQQASLAETLHRLGIALNFRDHQRLKETSVLKPQWVTEGIYGVLRFLQKQDCHGVLERARLTQALPAREYPPEKHDFVMELMEKFEVAFPLEHKEAGKQTERWLIPELLPEVQPAAFTEFRAAGVKRLRFSYPEALPPGLLPRFIVRTHEMSTGQARWRSGVVLAWGEARALVRLDRSQRQATVEVRGASLEEAQGLFDIIRAHLIILHGKVRAVEELELAGHPDSWVSMEKLRLLEREGLQDTREETKERALVKVEVSPTLDTTESKEARDAGSPGAPRPLRLFVSYAHADEKKLKGKLSPHLTILSRRGYIQPWEDKQLIAGEDWEERIMKELEEADIVLLIYSTHSRASEFVQQKEIPKALARANEDQCALLVVPLDRKDWDEDFALEQQLSKRMTATWNAQPVLKFTPQADGWQEVEHSIRKAVQARRGRRGD
ncbi:MAG TPA: COR domain-containing protein, partial [Chthoniobacteraceae bacterium]|nr:COR domain-containing protein [Chthoniobacteraceae bacterium]